MPRPPGGRRSAFSREMLGEKLLHGGALNGRSIEIADETGHVVDVVNSRDVLFSRTASFAHYPDDVTQSAPTNAPSQIDECRQAFAGRDQPEKILFARARQVAGRWLRPRPPGWE